MAFDDVYQDRLLEKAGSIARNVRLPAPDATASATSRACGSRVTVDLMLDGDIVADYGQAVDACALGSASASIVAEAIVGQPAAAVRHARDQLEAMLKRGGPPPDGAFAELALLEPAKGFTNRHGSMLLALTATVKALAKLGK
jgi:NifU-like protein involved in Fe-S cluster formation